MTTKYQKNLDRSCENGIEKLTVSYHEIKGSGECRPLEATETLSLDSHCISENAVVVRGWRARCIQVIEHLSQEGKGQNLFVHQEHRAPCAGK